MNVSGKPDIHTYCALCYLNGKVKILQIYISKYRCIFNENMLDANCNVESLTYCWS